MFSPGIWWCWTSWQASVLCAHCQTRKRANGKVESYHAMLAATLVAPGHAMALPLMPAFIAPQDGAEKQDCERMPPKAGWLSMAFP